MASNISKVHTVPDKNGGGAEVEVVAGNASSKAPLTTPTTAKKKKKPQQQQPKEPKQFPQDRRGSSSSTKKKRASGRKSALLEAHATQSAQQLQQSSEHVTSKNPIKIRRTVTSDSAPTVIATPEATTSSSLSRQLTKEKKMAPKTRGSHMPKVTPATAAPPPIVRKRSNSLDGRPTHPAPRAASPTPSEGKIIRKPSSSASKKARASSLKNAVQATKSGGKASSLKNALAASKQEHASDRKLYVRKSSINSDTKAIRKSSPAAAQKRKSSLKAKIMDDKPPKLPSTEFTTSLSATEAKEQMDMSARSTASASQKRKNSLKARKLRAKQQQQQQQHHVIMGASNGDMTDATEPMDTSTRSTNSIKSLPANMGSVTRRKSKLKQSPYASPQVIGGKPKIKLQKTPHPQSATGTTTKASSKPRRTQSVANKSTNNPRPASLSPKRHSHGKVSDTMSIQMQLQGDLLSEELLPAAGFTASNGHAPSPPPPPDPLLGTKRTTSDPLLGTKKVAAAPKTPPPPNRTAMDLEARLKSQQFLDQGFFSNDDDAPAKRSSDTSLTFTSTMTLNSTVHGHEHMLTPKREQGRGSIAMGTLSNSQHSTSSKLSTYAGDIATPSTRLNARPSLAPSMVFNSHSHKPKAAAAAANNKQQQPPPPKKAGSLTYFGNPLVPIDIVPQTIRTSKMNLMHHKDAVQVLDLIKEMKRAQLKVRLDSINSSAADLPLEKLSKTLSQQDDDEESQELKCMQLLKTAGTSTSATISMTGYKGGALENQINHDRSLIVSPFYLRNHGNSMVRRRLMGVFDGHAEKGSVFAEHCQQLLPSLLSRKLSEAFKRAVEDIAAGIQQREDEVAITKRVLVDTFVTMDESSPHEAAGGCTATVVYQQGQKIFVANTGDSRSCIVVYRRHQASHAPPLTHSSMGVGGVDGGNGASSLGLGTICEAGDKIAKSVKVVYISREDKPDLPEERARLEEWGGEIIEAEKNKSAKVKFHGDGAGKATATLSMSRSIGDSQFTALGVIADPIVDVIDLKELLEREKSLDTSGHDNGSCEEAVDDICVFALCASDGMMIESIGDAEAVAMELAPSLFNDDAPHPLTACQSVITKSAATWDRRNKGKFRDDITVAVTVLRTPPAT